MIQLRVLGGLELHDEAGTELHSVLAQPRRIALVCYLAIGNPGHYRRRDALLALFWPESDVEHARHALRQAVYFLRRSLGADVIISRGDEEIGIAPAALYCDAAELDRLCAAGRPGAAVELYRGELLPAFHLEGARAFEEWLEAERTRLRRVALEASGRLVDELLSAGGPESAIARARWRVGVAPAEVEPTRRLMRLLCDAGMIGEALQAYREHAGHLAAQYETDPVPELQALAAELTARPSAGPPTPPAAPTVPAALPAEPTPAALAGSFPRRGSRPSYARHAIALFLLVALVSSGLLARTWRGRTNPQRQPIDTQTIAVMPFTTATPDASLAYLGEGVADLVSGAFTGEAGPRALDMRAVQRALAQSTGGTREPARAAAVRLGTQWYVDGSVVLAPNQIVLEARLFDTPSGRPLGTARENGALDSFPALAHRLAAALLVLSAGARTDGLPPQVELPALRAYLQGRIAYRRGSFYEAAQHFRTAVRIDSSFAPAAFGLLQSSSWTGVVSARSLAWRLRDQLPPRDRDYVIALLGDSQEGYRWSAVQHPAHALERWHAYLQRWSDHAEGWYELGDRYLHGGAIARVPDHLDRAERAFLESIRLEPAFAPAYLHLLDIQVERGVGREPPLDAPWRQDLARRARHYFDTLAPGERHRTAEAWRAAFALGDQPWLREVRARFDSMPRFELHQVVRSTQALGWPPEDAHLALDVLEKTAATPPDARGVLAERFSLALNAGQPAVAQRATEAMERLYPDKSWHLFRRVEGSLLGDGDTMAARAAARDLERIAAGPRAPGVADRHDQALAAFFVEAWRLMRGESGSTAAGTIARIREALVLDTTAAAVRGAGEFYAAYLEALAAARARHPRALEKAIAADSVLLRHWGDGARPWMPYWVVENGGHALLMRLHEMRGEYPRAADAARRRAYQSLRDGTSYLSSRLLVEAGHAAAVGDTAAARRAYRHFLALRPNPHAGLQPLNERVTRELQRLARD